MNGINMLGAGETIPVVIAMGLVILFCRVFPFLFFAGSKQQKKENLPQEEKIKTDKSSARREKFFGFVERIVPPVAMTVLAFNALGGGFKENPLGGLLVLTASLFTAGLHLWKKNALISIFTGTALYMILIRVIPGF